MNGQKVVDFIVDAAPFVIYLAVLGKLYFSWQLIKVGAEEIRRHRLEAILLILAIVIGLLLASNVYALAVYGKTFMSLPVFQLFIVGNCVVYWLLLDALTRDSVPAEGRLREFAE